jgi:hypothetical protein
MSLNRAALLCSASRTGVMQNHLAPLGAALGVDGFVEQWRAKIVAACAGAYRKHNVKLYCAIRLLQEYSPFPKSYSIRYTSLV